MKSVDLKVPFWFCSCRHPHTPVYYADELQKVSDERDQLIAYNCEIRGDILALRVALQTIVDSYGPAYGHWDFVGIACNALDIPHPEVKPGAVDDLTERFRAALQNIALGRAKDPWHCAQEALAQPSN